VRITPAAELLVAVAAAEAQQLQHPFLEGEHVFLGLLTLESFSEQRQSPLPTLTEKAWKEAQAEISQLARHWQGTQVSCQWMRRRLRGILKDCYAAGPFTGHRSPACRRLFEQAEKLALQEGRENAGLMDLLRACLGGPSNALDQLLEEFNLSRDDLVPTDRRPRTKAEAGAPAPRKCPTPYLDHFGRDLTALAREGKIGPVIGRRQEILQIARILSQRMRNNALLIGDAGVGKTAIVEGLALSAVRENPPSVLRGLRVVEIPMSSLISGAILRGQFEERLREILKEAREAENIVLFIDEIHTIVGAGTSSGAPLDAGNILKPALAHGEIRLIGATTIEEYRRYIERDSALRRRFELVWVEEPSREEALDILRGLRPAFEEHHQVEIPDEVLIKTVDLSIRYILDRRLPDKAITLLDEACAVCRVRSLSSGSGAEGDQHLALSLRDLATAVARRARIPVEVLLEEEKERLLRIEEALEKRVFGQPHAVHALAEAIRTARAGLRPAHQPIVLMFTGPTGTGKTELAKALADFLFYDESRLIAADMSEYQHSHDLYKIIGSPPGYVGHGEEGMLIREVRTHPYSIVLLDEFEKAHPDVQKVFLQVFDEGRLTDGMGRRVNFSEAIIILTSNLGADLRGAPSFGIHVAKGVEEEYEQKVLEIVDTTLRPELRNRIQRVIVFRHLSPEVVSKILDKYISEVNRSLIERDISLEMDDAAKEILCAEGFSERYGARELRRVFDQQVSFPLSQMILQEGVPPGSKVICQGVDGEIRLTVAEGERADAMPPLCE